MPVSSSAFHILAEIDLTLQFAEKTHSQNFHLIGKETTAHYIIEDQNVIFNKIYVITLKT